MNFPENLRYTKTHEWLELNNDLTARMGITDYAQDALGVLVYLSLPQPGEAATKQKMLCEAESVKAVSEVYSPVDGVVAEVNSALEDAPELVNSDPYGAWMVKLENVSGTVELMDASAYKAFIEAEGEA